MFTPLHRALGIEPCPLTMDLVRRAVTDGITEREDLDWKKTCRNARGYGPRNSPRTSRRWLTQAAE